MDDDTRLRQENSTSNPIENADSSIQSEEPRALDAQYRQSFGVLAGYLPKDRKHIAGWLSSLAEESRESQKEFAPSVQAMADLLDSDDALRKQVETMIRQGADVHRKYEPEVKYSIETIDQMLAALNHIIGNAPRFDPDVPHSAFPMSGLFVYMMWTPAGYDVFRNDVFNNALRTILNAWCDYLDSPASLNVVTTEPGGWLSEASYKANSLDQFVTEDQIKADPIHWGYRSFNDFFHRQIIPICRPVDAPGRDRVLTSANDGTVYRIARDVKRTDTFDCKGQNYSLEQMLDGSSHVDRFVGGDVVQSFLSGNDYHRWWAPVAGTIVEARVVPGYMFSELPCEGFDPSAGTKSQVYEANVNTRGLVFIESDDPAIGMVCVVPIGITEISSIAFQVKAGDRVEKGQELGWFSYGGSSMCLVFQPGAIEQFTIVDPQPNINSDDGPFIRVGAQIAIATAKKNSK